MYDVHAAILCGEVMAGNQFWAAQRGCFFCGALVSSDFLVRARHKAFGSAPVPEETIEPGVLVCRRFFGFSRNEIEEFASFRETWVTCLFLFFLAEDTAQIKEY